MTVKLKDLMHQEIPEDFQITCNPKHLRELWEEAQRDMIKELIGEWYNNKKIKRTYFGNRLTKKLRNKCKEIENG